MGEFSDCPLANARLEGLRWLEGFWSGQVNGDDVDEVWAAASAGAMMGMFRCVSKGKVRFYEFMTISKNPERIDLTIKHFNAGLVGWEEKDNAVRFVLTESAANRAVFYQSSSNKHLWLIYESSDESALKVYFRPVENSPVGDSEFTFHRRVGDSATG